MLAHVRHLAANASGEVADRQFAFGKGLQHAEPLWIRERTTDGGEPLPIGIRGFD